MITTEPNDVLAPSHDRMPVVLGPEQIGTYLAGELKESGPSAGGTQVQGDRELPQEAPESG